MIKDNKNFYYFYKFSISTLFFVFLFCILNFQISLSFFSMFEIATPSLISIVLYLFIVRFNINSSNIILLLTGFLHDIMIGNNIGITSIFLLLFKFFTNSIILEKINKDNQGEWIYFTIIFISTFSIVFLLNLLISLSLPELSPIFFHVGITLILFPIINYSINFFSYVSRLIKS